MKILSAIVAHDGRIATLQQVIDSALKVDMIVDLEIFCFDTEKKTIKLGEKNNLKINSFKRPETDRSKLSCSYWNIATGMMENELMHLSFLRNKVLDIAINYDSVFFIDSDVIIPKNGLRILVESDSDIAMGWYFHKRLPSAGVNFEGYTPEKEDECATNRDVVNGLSGGNGCVLVKKNVYENIKYNLYNGVKAEDVEYYRKAIDAGFKIKIDFGVHCDHLGNDWKPKAKEFAIKKSKLWNVKTPSFK